GANLPPPLRLLSLCAGRGRPGWSWPTTPALLPPITHAFDLVAFSIFMYFTHGPTSPFFVFLVFALLCAPLRWLWRGTLWTAVAALVVLTGLGLYAAGFLHDPEF